MSRVYLTAVAGLAFALSACAHTGAATTTPQSPLGGQAGQPAGWPDQLAAQSASSPNQWQATQPAGEASYLGGRSAQPASWREPANHNEQRTEASTPYACGGGRAGQPFGGPAGC
jgi:hypothetical protein